MPFTGEREKLAEELANFLTSTCDSVSIKRTIQLDKMSLIYQAVKVGETFMLVRPPIQKESESSFMMSQLSLSCICGEGKYLLIR